MTIEFILTDGFPYVKFERSFYYAKTKKNAAKSIELNEKKFYRLAEAETRYSLGKASMRRIADEAGAVLKVGRVVLIDRSKADQYLEDTFMI